MTSRELASTIDHTLLKPEAGATDVRRLCREAMEYGFMSVCVNPINVALATTELSGSPVKICSVIGFPLGASCTGIKVAEAAQAISDGATEIDMVIHVGALKDGRIDEVRTDMAAVAQTCQTNGAILKVIIETCLLSSDEIVTACTLAKEANADYVKTSTGFNSGGATTGNVALMRQTVGPTMGVKASGGIRTLDQALSLLEAGASRLGMSAGITVIKELNNR